MAKGKKIIIIVVAVVIVIAIGIAVMISNISGKLAAYSNSDFSGLNLAMIGDGTYTGSEDAGIIKVKVEVTVKDHAITKINLLEHKNGQGKPAEVIVNDIVAANSLEVDAISGATYSSQVIKTAVYKALMK